jgi:hypothetical protein
MSDQVEPTTQNESNENLDIGKYLSLILLEIIKDNPDYLLDKYKDRNWQDKNFQEKLTQYFSQTFRENIKEEEFLGKAVALFRLFLSPFTVNDEKFIDLCIKTYFSKTNTSNKNSIQSTLEFSILLVDIENISLDVVAEDYIKKSCSYPLKHCLAFGNWKKLGQKDEELHERCYELFHVPQGKNNADHRMTNIGSFICLNYPGIKEIFVCSSDKDLDILCNFLSKKDITVYRVFKEINNLCIKNLKTEEASSFPIISNSKLLKLETFIEELKQIIYQEIINNINNQQWFTISQISALFYKKHNLSLNQIVDYHFPGNKAKFIFSEYKNDCVIHNLPDTQEMFISLFHINLIATVSNHHPKNISQSQSIYSKESIEKILLTIVQEEMKKKKSNKVELNTVASRFVTQCAIPITKALKEAKLPSQYKSFIQSTDKLEIIVEGKKQFIGLCSDKTKSK